MRCILLSFVVVCFISSVFGAYPYSVSEQKQNVGCTGNSTAWTYLGLECNEQSLCYPLRILNECASQIQPIPNGMVEVKYFSDSACTQLVTKNVVAIQAQPQMCVISNGVLFLIFKINKLLCQCIFQDFAMDLVKIQLIK